MRTLLPRAGRRRLLVTGAAVIALGAAGIAIADSGSPATTSLVSATFYANTLARSHSSTCTPSSGDAYTTADVVFTGSASSADARLAGPITIHAKSVYDSATNVGSLTGEVSIDNGQQHGHFHARLRAVNANGVVQGWLDGDAGPGVHFMGSFSSTFSATGGFSSSGAPGTIGTGTGADTAIVWSGRCKNPSPAPTVSHASEKNSHKNKHHHD
jgi:hypothetical protein